MLSSVLVVVSLVQVGSVVGDSRSEMVEIQPCSVTTGVVSRDVSITYSLTGNFSLCPDNSSDEWQALRVSTWNSSSGRQENPNPLVFVTRQGKAVDSWTIPFQPPDFSIGFGRVNRSLCYLYNGTETDNSNLAYVDVFTSLEENVSFNIVFDPVPNYSLQKDTWYSLLVGASTPQVRMFTFPAGVEAVTVQAEASSSRCALLSVQNVSCPINDLLEEIKSKGHYQTMSTDGFITVTRKLFKNDSLSIVLITTNYSECHSSDYVPQSPLFHNGTVLGFDQEIRVIVRPLQSAPVLPILFPLFLFGSFLVIALVCTPMEKFLKCRWSPPCKVVCVRKPPDTQESRALLDDGDRQLTHNYGTSSHVNFSGDRSVGESGVEDSLELSVMEKAGHDLRLPAMCKTELKTLRSHYSVYSWNTVTVGIFYGLPAFQLVLSQQLLATSSGQDDLCYYNFKCSHPVGVLSSFNNVWSNIGYFLLGVTFIIVTFVRDARYTHLRKLRGPHFEKRGVPQFFGIYYAMGLALILEGVMSSFYHICPTNANFQFDTAFMFIIAGLILTKVFQNRHPDVHVNAFIAFFSFAVVLFFTLLGIHYDTRNPVAVRCSLLAMTVVMVAGFFTSFYYFHRWKLSKSMFRKVFKLWKCFSFKLHRIRFIKLLLVFVMNVLVAIVAVILNKSIDFATTILTFFLLNVVLFFSLYIVAKLYYRETWTLLPVVLPFIVLGLWIAALYFFLRSLTNWQLTPAESRNLNRPCSLLGFYDDHDIWHFLSACALFFSFLFIMTLDDGIEDWPWEDIHVF